MLIQCRATHVECDVEFPIRPLPSRIILLSQDNMMNIFALEAFIEAMFPVCIKYCRTKCFCFFQYFRDLLRSFGTFVQCHWEHHLSSTLTTFFPRNHGCPWVVSEQHVCWAVSNHIRTCRHTHLFTHVPRCTPRSKTSLTEGKPFFFLAITTSKRTPYFILTKLSKLKFFIRHLLF